MTNDGVDKVRQFICLDPRRRKREAVLGTISSLGPISWRRFPPVKFGSWPETSARAEAALLAARTVPKNSVVRWIKKSLFAVQYNGSRSLFTKEKGAIAVAWNGLNGSRRAFMDGARDAGAVRLFFELAPLPGRITVDPCGVNFHNGLPRKIDPYLHWFKNSGLAPDIWRAQARKITARQTERKPVPHSGLPSLSSPFLFVPLQVPGDSQLRLFGGAFTTVDAFVACLIDVADRLPEGWHLRLKEHPSSPSSVAHFAAKMANRPVFFDNVTDTFEQVAASRGVITVNSSVGLEAMFFDKPVVAAGQCFWAIEGVAQTATTPDALGAVLAAPDRLGFDRDARDAFLSFITEYYYPKFDSVQGDTPTLGPAEVRKIAERLNRTNPPHFWECSQ